MNIFVDLDGTLFDTPRLGTDTAAKLKAELSIETGDYEEARREMFGMNNKIYSAELHARRLAKRAHINESMLVKRFIELFNNEDSEKYVYADSPDFLRACSTLGTVVILTYGEAFVQTPRVTKSGLRNLVSDVIVTQHNKADTIKEFFEPEDIKTGQIVLIDDSTEHLDNVKKQFPDATTIHLVRNEATTTPPEHKRALSLGDALAFIDLKQ